VSGWREEHSRGCPDQRLCHPVPVLDQTMASNRRRPDRCPGLTRPWLADDGALVRLRLVGGCLPSAALAALVETAGRFGDGNVHLTRRANVQLRGIPHHDGRLPEELVSAVHAAGLVPSETHELVRNVMVSPLSGRVGGRADLRPVARELERLLLADPSCAGLSGRFLFVLDDGRGDLLGRASDLAAVALDAGTLQVRSGTDQWGPRVRVEETAAVLHSLTRRFLGLRGEGPTAAWHVDELDGPLLSGVRDGRTRVASEAPPWGLHGQSDGRVVEHVPVPGGVLRPGLAEGVLSRAGDELVVTPWHSLLLADLEAR
jgi:precorrin-3B synthase